MRYPLISITREFGAGAGAIAAATGAALGVPVYDKQVVAWAAERAGVSEETIRDAEHDHGLIGRIIEGLSYVPGPGGTPASCAALTENGALYTPAGYREIVRDLVVALADAGSCVLVGHAGQAILRERPDVLKVFLHAPFEDRVRRVVVQRALAKDEARRLVEQSDRESDAFLKTHFHANRHDLRLYDLTLNTACRIPEDLAEEIGEAARKLAIRRSCAG